MNLSVLHCCVYGWKYCADKEPPAMDERSRWIFEQDNLLA